MKKHVLFFLMTLVALTGVFASGSKETIIFVDSHNEGNEQDGTSWDSAYNNLTDALNSAEEGDEIWAAAGTYTPSDSDREVFFQMKDGVSVYGGFDGTETKLDQRDWLNNRTVLSGEIGNPDTTDDNTMTIVMAANNVIDGVTITGGNGSMNGTEAGGVPQASSSEDCEGGEAPSVGHMSPMAILSAGAAPGTGAAMIIWQVSPEIRNTVITGNSSGKAGGVYIVGTGAEGMPGVSSDMDMEQIMPLFLNCEISDNTAVMRGGGVAIDMGGSAWFIDTVFTGNSTTEGKGGAIYNDFGCSPILINCLFYNNFAQSGGAMGNDGESHPVIYNTTYFGNEASASGAALYQGSGPYNDPIVINSIIWGNICLEDEASIFNWNDCYTSVSYSVVEGGYTGTAILTEDPEFTSASANDFSYSASSVLTTAGIDGDRIGYSKESAASRTDDEVAALQEYVQELATSYTPVILDRENMAVLDDSLSDYSVLYVSKGATGNGSSWSDASGSLQDMIDQAGLLYAETGDALEVWVSEGVYLTGSDRSDSFLLRDGVEVYGGFSGNETDLNERLADVYQTVISGDIGVSGQNSDNSYHVFIGADDALLDGLYITGGYADGADGEVYDNKGGAVLNYWGGYRVKPSDEPTLGFDMTFNNCVFYDNYAQEGGAVYTYHGGNPVFTDCDFTDNRANYGGANVDRGGVNSIYENCTFTDNTVQYKGGAIFVDYGAMATILNCEFTANEAGTSGGAVYVIDRASQSIPNETDINMIDPDWKLTTDIFSSLYVADTEFTYNQSGIDGGALYIYENSNLKLVDCDFIGNNATRYGDSVTLINSSVLYLAGDSNLKNNEVYRDNSSTISE